MKGSRKIAEAAKVVEICKKIKQEYPKFELNEWHLNLEGVAAQKMYQIKFDYDCYVQLYNRLHKQKLVNDYFETEEGKALKLQLQETIKNAKKKKNKILSEYHKIFSDIVKSEFGKDFSLDKNSYDLKIANRETIKSFSQLDKEKEQKIMFSVGCCYGKMMKDHPFIEIRCYKGEIIVETFGFEFIDLSKSNESKMQLFIKTASFLNNKELQNKIISLFNERREKLDGIYKIIETAENKLKNPLENEGSIS